MMLVDQSARVWAMRADDVVAAQALKERADRADGLPPQSAMGGALLEGSDFARVIDGVAIIPVKGPLMRSFSFWAWSYEEIGRDLRLAQADRGVRSIILDIDSPGGLVAGCSDLAAAIRTSGPKPVEAFVGGMAASAAYWLASAADRIVVGSGAILGSVGAVIEYVDIEPMFEKMGARIVRIVSAQSPNKRLDPDSPEGKAEMQALVDASGKQFVEDVSANRGIGVAEVMANYGGGLVFDGRQAVALGMADARGTLDEMIAELAGRDFNNGNAAPAAAAQETPMDWATLTLAALREHRADIITELTAAAVSDAEARGAAAERARLSGIEAIAVAGHEALVEAAKADGKTTPEQLALQILRADKAAGAQHLQNRAEADAGAQVPASVVPAAAGGAALPDTAPLEDRAKAAWGKDPALRAEFGNDFAAYLAFEKANASGAARILRAAR